MNDQFHGIRNRHVFPREFEWAGGFFHLDWMLIVAIVLIFLIGEAVLYSAAGDSILLVIHQGEKFILSLVFMIIVAQTPIRRWKRWSMLIYGFGLLLLVGVLIGGHIGLGARRWLDIGPVQFQPSEFMKVALPMMLAWLYSRRGLPIQSKVLFIGLFVALLPVFLIAKEPDLGTALLILMGAAAVTLFAGIRWRWILLAIVFVAALGPLAWHFLHGYQKERILVFLHPQNDPLGAGYHIIQSMIAIGSSGLYGMGWPHAPQAQLGFLPESSTDFIFAVFSEEFGLFGTIFLIILYLFVIFRGFWIAGRAHDNFSRLLGAGLVTVFAIDVFVNIGMTMGLLPVVGVPLPFMSYGGTSLLVMAILIGLLQSIARHQPLIKS